MKRGLRLLIVALAVIVLVPLAVIALSERFGWNWARTWLERSLGRGTGREVELAGDLDVDLGWHPRVTARSVRLGNASWASDPAMFAADGVAIRFPLLPLLYGRIELDELELTRGKLVFEVDESGRANWNFGGGKSPSSTTVALPAELAVHDSTVVYVDRATGDRVSFDFAELDATTRSGSDIVFGARGLYQRLPLEARGRIGTIDELRGGGPYPLRAEATIGPTHVRAVGLIEKPKSFDGVNLDLRFDGKSLSELWTLVGLPLAHTPPYRAAGRLKRDGATWSFEKFAAVIGKSDLAGDLAVTLRPEDTPLLRATLSSKALDTDDVEGFWGHTVSDDDGEDRGAAAKETPVFSDRPFNFTKLRAMDAAVDFRAGSVRGGSMLDDVRLRFALERGRLRLDPLELGFAGGRIASHATIDASGASGGKSAKLAGDIVLRSIDVLRLLQAGHLDQKGTGTIGGRAEIRTSGNSLHSMAEHLDGNLGVAMQDAVLSEELLELAALDLGQVLVRRVKGDREMPVRCMVGVFGADDGRLTAETLLLDTREETLQGEGTIDLGKERIDLRLYENPVRFSMISLPSPILVEGTLSDRRVRLDRSGVAKRGGAAVLLGTLVHPFAALLALVELPGKEEPGLCRDAIHDYETIAATRTAEREHAPKGSTAKPGKQRLRR